MTHQREKTPQTAQPIPIRRRTALDESLAAASFNAPTPQLCLALQNWFHDPAGPVTEQGP